ncbi:MAG: DUF4920 domain-containing protein [Myxococcota bacterium]
MARITRLAFLLSAFSLVAMGCDPQAGAEETPEPEAKAVQEAAPAEQPAGGEQETTTAEGAATAKAGAATACPHAKAGECPKAEGCDGNCDECPHAKAGTCPHADEGGCDGNCDECPHAKAGACPHAEKAEKGCDGDCPHAKGAECDHGKKAEKGCDGDCPHAKGAECDHGKKAEADYADEAHCPFSGDEADGDHAHAAKAKAAGHECGHHGAEGTVAGDVEGKHYGEAFSVKEQKNLAAVLSGDDVPDAPVRVSGTIEEVCQKAGCWFVLEDGEKKARITMGRAFTVPKDSKGRKAQVEGTVTVRTFTEEQVKHLEADRGGDPSKVEGSRKEFVLKATGATIEG